MIDLGTTLREVEGGVHVIYVPIQRAFLGGTSLPAEGITDSTGCLRIVVLSTSGRLVRGTLNFESGVKCGATLSTNFH